MEDIPSTAIYIMIESKENISQDLYTNSVSWEEKVQFPFKMFC